MCDDSCRVHNKPHAAKNAFLYNLRLRYWKKLFDAREFTDRLTSNVQSQLHSRINEFSGYDFSLYNIYQLYIDLGTNLIDNIKETIVKLFDDFTARHSWAEYSSNVLHYNGWKTNDAFKINSKVIIPMHGSMNYWRSDGSFSFGYNVPGKLRDIEKTFDYLAGTTATDHDDLNAVLKDAEQSGKRRNVRFKHFSASFFKKGTCHLVFHNPALVKKLNIFAGQQKKWLPPGYGSTSYSEMNAQEKAVIKSFEGEKEYSKTIENRQFYLFHANDFLQLGYSTPESA